MHIGHGNSAHSYLHYNFYTTPSSSFEPYEAGPRQRGNSVSSDSFNIDNSAVYSDCELDPNHHQRKPPACQPKLIGDLRASRRLHLRQQFLQPAPVGCIEEAMLVEGRLFMAANPTPSGCVRFRAYVMNPSYSSMGTSTG